MWKELEITFQNAIFPDIAKFADLRWKYTDVSRNQGMYHLFLGLL